METIINPSIFNEENASFFNNYLELLINRVTHSTMALEKDLGNPDHPKNAIRLRDNMAAFKYLLNALSNNTPLDEELIIKVANTINRSSQFISDGYRHIGDHIADTDIPISGPSIIQDDMIKLLYNYENTWSNMDPYEREARFHIEFIRIHPFEDGNGRTGRLLLNFNMLKQGLAPIIIVEDTISDYHECIKNYDIESLKEMFYKQSIEECKIIDTLYTEYLELIDERKKMI